MARAALWAAGLAISALAHAGAGAVLWAAIRPDPVADQPLPETRLDMQAVQLERTEARAAEARPESAARADAAGTALDPGAIPQNRARPAALPTAAALAPARARPDAAKIGAAPAPRLAAQSPAPAPVAAAPPSPEALSESPAEADALAAQTARPEALMPLDAPTALAAPVRPGAQPLAATAEPLQTVAQAAPIAAPALPLAPGSLALPSAATAPQALPPSRPTSAPAATAVAATQPLPAAAARADPALAAALPSAALPPSPPRPSPAPAAQPDATTAAAAAPQGARVKATLTFPGGAGGVDPVSLAAFQSFMQPGDAAAGADRLRDGLAGLLAQVPCSRLQVSFVPDTATLQVKGHIPEDGLRGPVLAALREQMGADIAVSDSILILPRPQCGALSGIADVGLPQSTDQITNPLLVGADTHARVLDYARGDRLWFDLTAPDYAAYVYVDYFDAGGDVIHLAPNEQSPLRRAEAKSALRVGAREAGAPGLQIVVGPPYGQEIAVAFAASAPLYEGLRPLIEPAAPYLEWLKARVAQARAADPDFKGEWVYFFVTTADR